MSVETNGRVTNSQLKEAIDDAKSEIKELFDEKLNSLRWQMLAAIGGSGMLSSVVAALVTKTTPAEAGRAALRALGISG